MQIKEILVSIPVLFFIFWVFAAPLPQDRIARTCSPIEWVGNLATSATALTKEEHTGVSAKWSDKLSYSCQYLIWRLMYQDEYNKAVSEGRVHQVEGSDKPVITEQEYHQPDEVTVPAPTAPADEPEAESK